MRKGIPWNHHQCSVLLEKETENMQILQAKVGRKLIFSRKSRYIPMQNGSHPTKQPANRRWEIIIQKKMMSYENDQRSVCVRKSKYKAKMNKKHTELKWDLSSLDKWKKIKIRNKVHTVKENRIHWKQQ